jgi:hypothetical protein
MFKTRNKEERHRPSRRRLAALVCAVVYLTGGMEALPLSLALGAWLEGSHTISVACDQGQIRVILSHERDVARPADHNPRPQSRCVRHRHGTAARVICLFAPYPSANGDHVGQFTSSQVCENSARAAKRKDDDTRQHAFAVAANALLSPQTLFVGAWSYPASPEPAIRLCLILTSSTLLTI